MTSRGGGRVILHTTSPLRSNSIIWPVIDSLISSPFSAHANGMLSEGADLSSFSFSVSLIPPQEMFFLCMAAGVKCILYIARSSLCLSVTCVSVDCVPVRKGDVQ